MIRVSCQRLASFRGYSVNDPVVLAHSTRVFELFTRYEVGVGPSWRVLRFTPLALADSGSAPLYQLSLPLTSWTVNAHEDALPGIFLASLLLLVLLAGALWIAWAAIRSAGALPKPVPIISRNTNRFLIDT